MAAAFTMALLAEPQDYLKFLDQGIALERAGNYADAAAAFREAVAIAEREKLGDRAVANALNSLGMTYDELGKPSEAARQYRRAISLMEHAKGKDSADYAV